ncbi:hypothetical protein D3C71_2077230 [compost metagenome]
MKLRIDLRRQPAHFRPQFIHIAARPLGPGQAGSRKQQHAGQQDPAERNMHPTTVLKAVIDATFWSG